MAGPGGFEPPTCGLGGSLENDGIKISGLRMENTENFWKNFREWLDRKYSKGWARTIFYYSRKYCYMLNGSLSKLESFSKIKRAHILKSLIALSKYLGVYEEFKRKIESYGIKWERQNALKSFLRMMRPKEGLLDWVRECLRLNGDLAIFIEFLMISGLRKGEAINSFNLIIKLAREGKLEEYYNFELQSLLSISNLKRNFEKDKTSSSALCQKISSRNNKVQTNQ